MGAAGFEELLHAFANGEITPDHYISWVYDLETRWPDGPKLSEDFETLKFARAEDDDSFAKKIAHFYKAFSTKELEELQSDPRPGAKKVATIALNGKQPQPGE